MSSPETRIAVKEIDSSSISIKVRRLGGKALEHIRGYAHPDLQGAGVMRGRSGEHAQNIAQNPDLAAGQDMQDMDPDVTARVFALHENRQGNQGTLPEMNDVEEHKYH